MVDYAALVKTAVLILVGGASPVVLTALAWQGWQTGKLLPYEPRRPVPWQGRDVAAVVLIYLAALTIGQDVSRRLSPPGPAAGALDQAVALAENALPNAAPPDAAPADDAPADAAPQGPPPPPNTGPQPAPSRKLLIVGASELAALLLGIGWLRARSGATWDDLGIAPRYWLSDVRVGGLAFVAICGPVYGLQALLIQFYPSEHDVLRMLRSVDSLWEWLLCAATTALVVPCVEEFVCRLTLQGWLETWCERLPGPTLDATTVPTDIGQPTTESQAPAIRRAAAGQETGPFPPVAIWPVAGWASVLASSLIFAILHPWPDCAPLFLFALVLGYLYRQTHRLLPSIIVHLLLNAVSLAQVWAEVSSH